MLGEAMEGAEAPGEVDGVDADDGPVGEAIGEDFQRDAVVRIVEGWNEDSGIGDVKIRVAGRKVGRANAGKLEQLR